jgi:hypothetical protein
MDTIKTLVSIDDVIDYLNELLALDGQAIAALVANRVPCNELLADHRSVQVQVKHGVFYVGLLGVINGMFGTIDGVNGPVATVFDDGRLVCFARRDEY